MKEINLEGILKRKIPNIPIYVKPNFKAAMKEAIQQALELAAENASVVEENYSIPGVMTMMPLYRTVVDKQSIINIINLVV